MGFHTRYITNKQVIELYKTKGISGVIKLYNGKADALVLENGIASIIDDLLLRMEETIVNESKQDIYNKG